ncbi:hypothetical protein Gotur_020786 [Gossypium turneri]
MMNLKCISILLFAVKI